MLVYVSFYNKYIKIGDIMVIENDKEKEYINEIRRLKYRILELEQDLIHCQIIKTEATRRYDRVADELLLWYDKYGVDGYMKGEVECTQKDSLNTK